MPLPTATNSSASVDVVGVWDSAFRQVFPDARPMKATVTESSKTFEHPVETGSVITDFRIILPVMIELPLMLSSADYQNVYQQIRQLFLSGQLLTVQTRSGSYPNMLITDIPHDETPEEYDAITLVLKLRQTLFVSAQFGKLPPRQVANPANSSTVDKGEQQPEESNRSSLLFRLVD